MKHPTASGKAGNDRRVFGAEDYKTAFQAAWAVRVLERHFKPHGVACSFNAICVRGTLFMFKRHILSDGPWAVRVLERHFKPHGVVCSFNAICVRGTLFTFKSHILSDGPWAVRVLE